MAVEAEVRVEVAAAVDRLLLLMLVRDGIPPALRVRVGTHDEKGEEVRADEREHREEHPRAHDDLLVEVRADLEGVGRGGYGGDVIRSRLLDRLARRVVLLDELGAGRLLWLDRRLVEDEEPEETDERQEQPEAERREDDVEVDGRHYSVISRTLGSQAFA